MVAEIRKIDLEASFFRILKMPTVKFRSLGKNSVCSKNVSQGITDSQRPFFKFGHVTIFSAMLSRFTMNNIAAKLQKCYTHKIAFKII